MTRLLLIALALSLLCQSGSAQRAAEDDATTTLAIWVNPDGKVRRVEIRKSCGRHECDAAAMSRAFTLEFPPALVEKAQSAPRLFVIGSGIKELPQ